MYLESDRFLGNVFAASQIDEDNNDDNTQYVIKFRSKEAMVRSQAGPRGKNVVMTMENFDMEVVNIETKNELKEWNADEDVLSIEKGTIEFEFNGMNSFSSFLIYIFFFRFDRPNQIFI